jgi:hypothetical protein
MLHPPIPSTVRGNGKPSAERIVALVAPHFPPSNLAGVHRTRLLAQHLHEFGWRPIIVTTHWRHYEEALDWGLASLVDPELEIIRTPAAPTRPVRLVGDIGIRALPWHLAALRRLWRERRVDFVHITVPSFYSAVLGELLYRRAPLPFGIDYIDPWVHTWPEAEVRYSKAWLSLQLAHRLEPWATRNAALITGVASGYFEGVLHRNPGLQNSCVTAAMPYGFSERDFTASAVTSRRATEFDAGDGCLHLVYAGALLPKAHAVMERLLLGVARLKARGRSPAHRLKLHFIGTGRSPQDTSGHNVLPLAQRLGLADAVTEHPHRMAYLDALANLAHAAGVLIVGSTEPHYTPSKVYQAVQSRRPVLALLHQASSAIEVLEKSRAGMVIKLPAQGLPEPDRIADALEAFLSSPYDAQSVAWSAFEAYSARASAHRLAAALDKALERFPRDKQRACAGLL